MELRAECPSLRVNPRLGGLVFAFYEDGMGAPVRLFTWQIIASFEDQNALSDWGKRLGE